MSFIIEKPLYGFISTGDKTALYTLRIMYSGFVEVGGTRYSDTRDYYIKNLSNDKDKANERGLLYCKDENIPFKSGAEFDLNEIKRRNVEEVAAQKEREERERAELRQYYKELREAEFEQALSSRTLLCGKYTGYTIEDVLAKDRGYVFWLARIVEDEEIVKSKFSINCEIARTYVVENSLTDSEWVGKIDEILTTEVTLVKARWTESRFPSLLMVFEDPTGNELVTFTTSKKFVDMKIGESANICGLVVEHREWNSRKSTLLKKIKLVK